MKPIPFYTKRIVNEFFVGYYGLGVLDINGGAGLNRPWLYLRNSMMGPYASTELCDIFANWQEYRVYNTHTYMVVCRRRYDPTVDAYVEAGVGLQFPDGRYQKNSQPNWNIWGYIYDSVTKQYYNNYNDNYPFANFEPA